MTYLDRYKARINVYGLTEQERIINEGIQSFEEYLLNAPNKDTVEIDGIEYDGVIQDISLNNDKGKSDEKYLLTHTTTPVNIGSVVKWKSKNWLIVSLEDKVILTHHTTTIKPCNHTLRFLNSQGQICNNSNGYPCIYVNKSSNLIGTDENRFLTSPKTVATIDLPSNAETDLIIRENRFLVGDDAYKVTSVEKVEKQGIIHLVLEEDVITTNDNLILGIADYYNNLHTYSIDITNSNATLLVNDTLQLNTICKDNNEVVETPIITYASSNTSVATVDSSGIVTCLTDGNVTITAIYNGVSDVINITVQSVPVVDDFSIVINGLDLIPVGQTKTYNAVVYNNGVEVNDKTVIWSLNNSNASIVNQSGLSVSVKAGSVANVNVELRAELSDDVSVVGVKNIGIKSLY